VVTLPTPITHAAGTIYLDYVTREISLSANFRQLYLYNAGSATTGSIKIVESMDHVIIETGAGSDSIAMAEGGPSQRCVALTWSNGGADCRISINGSAVVHLPNAESALPAALALGFNSMQLASGRATLLQNYKFYPANHSDAQLIEATAL
jgi:hypothetical protein